MGEDVKGKSQEQDYETKYKYLLADYDNYRKRVEREAEIKIIDAKAKLLTKLLSIKDDFERALESLEKGDSKDMEVIKSGLRAILKNIDSLLKEEGVTPIEALGKTFDPNLHEVVSIVIDNELPEYTVKRELRRGYMFYNKVIRPSLVEISKKDPNLEGSKDMG